MTTVLVVEDHPALRALIETFLSTEGYVVVTAADGRQALRSVACRRPDVVLSDLHMPQLDGRGLLRALACSDPGLPVILMSSDRHVADVAAADNAAGAIRKPFDPDDLLALLARIVA